MREDNNFNVTSLVTHVDCTISCIVCSYGDIESILHMSIENLRLLEVR